MNHIIQDSKSGMQAAWLPFATIVILLFAMTAITMYQAGQIGDAHATMTPGLNEVPIGSFLTNMLAGFVLVAGLFVCWCWFVTNWIENEFGIRNPIGKSRYLKHVIWRQFLACVIASFVGAIITMPTLFIMAWTVIPAVMDAIMQHSPTHLTISLLLSMVSLVAGIPAMLMMSYLYLRYSAGLVVGAKSGELMGTGAAFSHTPENTPNKHVFRTAWKMTLFVIVVSTISQVCGYLMLLAAAGGASTIHISQLSETSNILLGMPGFVATIAVPFGAALILIRFLRQVRVPDTTG